MRGLLRPFLQHQCGVPLTKSPAGKHQWWEEKWFCNPLLVCLSTSDMQPCMKDMQRFPATHYPPASRPQLLYHKTTFGLRVRRAKAAPAVPFHPPFSLSFCFLLLCGRINAYCEVLAKLLTKYKQSEGRVMRGWKLNVVKTYWTQNLNGTSCK